MAFNAGASSGNLVLIQKQTASNSASITFTTGISGYDVYYLFYYAVTIATNQANMLIQLSTDGGGSYSATGYNYAGNLSYSGGILSTTGSAQAAMFINQAIDNTGASANATAQGNVYLYNLSNSSTYKWANAIGTASNGGTVPIINHLTSNWGTTTAVNAFQIIMSAGNITTGTFKLYGIQN